MEVKKIEIEENGKLKEYDVLFTVKDEEKNKEYILYTDVNTDMDIYAAIYDAENKRIDYIEDPKERQMIEEILKTVKEEMQ